MSTFTPALHAPSPTFTKGLLLHCLHFHEAHHVICDGQDGGLCEAPGRHLGIQVTLYFGVGFDPILWC